MFTVLLIKRSGHTASLPWTILNVSSGKPLTWRQDSGKNISVSRGRKKDLALMCWSMRASKLMILMYPWGKLLLLSWEPSHKCQGVLCILLSARTTCWSLGNFKRGLQPQEVYDVFLHRSGFWLFRPSVCIFFSLFPPPFFLFFFLPPFCHPNPSFPFMCLISIFSDPFLLCDELFAFN